MSLDPVAVGDTVAWFKKAKSDLAAARCLAESKEYVLEQACFFCQQSVEKAMKGFLFWHGSKFNKTHNLRELSKSCIEIDPELEELLLPASSLNQFAVDYRYPGDDPALSLDEVCEKILLSKRIFSELSSRLPFNISKMLP